MTHQRAYNSPQAMRRAVTDRLKSVARPKGEGPAGHSMKCSDSLRATACLLACT